MPKAISFAAERTSTNAVTWWFAPAGGFLAALLMYGAGIPMTFSDWLPENSVVRAGFEVLVCVVVAYSGSLVIENFRRRPDGTLQEPTRRRVKNGKNITEPSSIRADYRAAIEGLLDLGDEFLALWASDNLEAPDMMQIGHIPDDKRDPKNPAKYKVMPSGKLLEAMKALPQG